MLDLPAAFDTLDHNLLVKRLRSYFGFSGIALQWFLSYLHGRSQRVIIGDTIFPPRYLEFGVPQGSILGPLLFTLYIAPLQDVILAYNLNYMFYADDSQVYIAINPNHPSDALTTLRQCVEHIFSWNTRNMLKSNPGKIEVLHFTSRFMKQPSFGDCITFAGTEINTTKKARNLGVIMDTNLSFSSHFNEICKKSTLAIRSIGRIRKYLSLGGLKMLVNTLVILRLDYCNCLLHGIPKYQTDQRDKLQRIQNTAARLVMGLKRSDHVTPILRNLHWLPVVKRIEFKILLITYKTIHGQPADYLKPLIEMYRPSWNFKISVTFTTLSSKS